MRRGVIDVEKATMGDEYVFLVQWKRLDDDDDCTLEPIFSNLDGCACNIKKINPAISSVCCGEEGSQTAMFYDT